MISSEHGPSGMGEVKDMQAPANMSKEMAAFVAANGSPFTNIRDFPVAPKVPDLRYNMPTKTTCIYGTASLSPHAELNGSYGTCIVTSADPLAPVPVAWSRTSTGAVDSLSLAPTLINTPNILARQYETSGFHPIIQQMRELGKNARAYRIVGHGLKVWVGKSNDTTNGQIEGGQFAVADSRNTTSYDVSSITATNHASEVMLWRNAPGQDRGLGMQATLMQSSSASDIRASLLQSKTSDNALLDATEGVTVRWTDNSEFEFQTCTDRGTIFPNKFAYGENGYMPGQPMVNSNGYANVAASNVYFMPTFDRGQTTYVDLTDSRFNVQLTERPEPYNDIRALGTFVSGTTATNTAGAARGSWAPLYSSGTAAGTAQDLAGEPDVTVASDQPFPKKIRSRGEPSQRKYLVGTNPGIPTLYKNFPHKETMNYWTPGISEQNNGQIISTDIDWRSYTSDAKKQFDSGLYADVTGVTASQRIFVQVVWHVEYVPKGTDALNATDSPYDAAFEELAPLLRDRRAFPIVVKGHSFFNNLKMAFKKAAKAIGLIATNSVGAVSAAALAMPAFAPVAETLALAQPLAKRLRDW